ncbi:hypothetical protein [Fimbriiglobus ruber]|nr:hypothetical protein [Fimbriiglobus ruber]
MMAQPAAGEPALLGRLRSHFARDPATLPVVEQEFASDTRECWKRVEVSMHGVVQQGTPMADGRHLPSIPGCAFGFCAAGSGVGSIAGTALNPWLFPPLPAGRGTPHEQMMTLYGGTLQGIVMGMGVGVVAGVVYAVLVRRARVRQWVPETAPSDP